MEQSNFKIEQSSDPKYSTIIFAINFEGPFSDFELLNRNILWSGIESSFILFDLLLCNGKGYNRFGSMKFNGSKLNQKSYKIETKISELIRIQSAKFFKEFFNNQFLDFKKSILSEEDIKKFATG